jgi:hypothetical protein
VDFWTPNSPSAASPTSRPAARAACPGHANDQGNDYSSVADWCQLHPHAPHAPHADLAPVDQRLPRRWPEHGLWDE